MQQLLCPPPDTSLFSKDVILSTILESHPLVVRRRLAVRCLNIIATRLCIDTLVSNRSISEDKARGPRGLSQEGMTHGSRPSSASGQ